MVSSGNLENLCKVVVLMITWASLARGAAMRISDFDSNKSQEKGDIIMSGGKSFNLKSGRMMYMDNISHKSQTTVEHFARHGLCSHEQGQQHFYRALKSVLCQINDNFTADLVKDLCKNPDRYMLYKWVGQLFDTDSDGYITHYEKKSYLLNHK